eukprot:Lithocolla_globosa_v1_NODE_2003_length_2214_cov_7.131079.p1 type:complete len:355 gc:universal NODE_2003_length_2214_cov_7.131079:1117-53(-)
MASWVWDECHIYSFALILMFGALLCVVTLQLARIFVDKHRLIHFHFVFCCLVFVWVILREVFFLSLVFTELPHWVDRWLYWPPTSLQFATYSLLVCFFTRFIDRDFWLSSQQQILGSCGVINFVQFAYLFCWLFVTGDVDESMLTKVERMSIILFVAVLYVLLTFTLGVFGWKFISRLESAPNKTVALPLGGTMLQVKIFYVIVECVFLGRCIYDLFIFFTFDYSNNGDEPFGVNMKCMPDPMSFCFIIIWEVIPTSMLLYFFNINSMSRASSISSSIINDQQAPNSEISRDSRGPSANKVFPDTSYFYNPNSSGNESPDFSNYQYEPVSTIDPEPAPAKLLSYDTPESSPTNL